MFYHKIKLNFAFQQLTEKGQTLDINLLESSGNAYTVGKYSLYYVCLTVSRIKLINVYKFYDAEKLGTYSNYDEVTDI